MFSGSELYDPYKSAEKQMQQLLEFENDSPMLASVVKPPIILSSPTSAFTTFTPTHPPQPLFISEDNKNIDPCNYETRSQDSSEKSLSPLTVNSHDNLSFTKDSNQNPISLSTLSLCSNISVESVDSNKNGYRLGYSNSAKTVEKKSPVPLRRTSSAVEYRRGREHQKGKLKMEDMLYGSGNKDGERYFGFPIITGDLDKSVNDNSPLFKVVSDAEKFSAEQELLKSMSEFEKLFSSSSPSPSSPSSKLFPSLVSSFHPEEPEKCAQYEEVGGHSGGLDSAYSRYVLV